MDPHLNSAIEDSDPTAESRKKDHIAMAFESRVSGDELDARFYYEPMLSAHPASGDKIPTQFLGNTLSFPLWVSSMTGGTQMAGKINENLARACKDFGMGMGLGSCRSLLTSDEHFKDFDVRPIIGEDLPLYANLGIAQVEKLLSENKVRAIAELLDRLRADGLIVHINPLQEWLQPEGDFISRSPLDTIRDLLDKANYPIIVKEVGQGFGPESLSALMKLPLAAVDLASNGGTNFSKLELLRANPLEQESYKSIMKLGHSATEMIGWINQSEKNVCKQLIISGGIRDFLDGYYLISLSKIPAIYGQASGFLQHALGDYDTLYQYVHKQVEGLKLAKAYLRVKNAAL